MTRIALCAALAALFLSATASTQSTIPPSSPESVVRVRLRVLRDQDHRYTVPIHVAGKEIEAGLDTGSVGLHMLSRAVAADALQLSNDPSDYAYGSGVRLKGVKATAPFQIGGAQGPLDFQYVQSIDCLPNRPNCPASRIPINQYGIMGDGIPDQGFEAILGIKPNEDAPVPHPLMAFSVRRWILDAPSERGTGRLVLNPSQATLQGFVELPVFSGPDTRLHDAVHGCLLNEETQQKICGAIEMDSGAPGISVRSPDRLPPVWHPGTPAALLFQDAQGATRAVEHLRTNQRPQASRLGFKQEPDARFTVIHAGISPYLCFSVAYGGDTMGLRPRHTAPEQPHAELR